MPRIKDQGCIGPILNSSSVVIAYLFAFSFPPMFPPIFVSILVDLDFFDNIWRPKRLKKKIFGKILTKSDDPHFSTTKIKDKYLRDWRFLPAKFDKLGSIWIAEDIIILWDTFNAKAYEIQNHTIAVLLKANFEMLWEVSSTQNSLEYQ